MSSFRPLAAFAIFPVSYISRPEINQKYKTQKERETNHLEELTRYQLINGVPGVSLMISKKGKDVLKYSSGYSNVETLQPMKTNTVCRIGSISKLFAAIAMDKLKIDFTKPISEFLPWLPQDSPSKDCKILDILRHESGIRHYKAKEMSDKETKSNKNFETAKEAIQYFGLDTDSLIDEKIGKFSYSTHSFTFLQAIVEEYTKISYTKFLQKQIFKEIGMYSTFPDQTKTIIPNRSNAYDRKSNKLENCTEIDQSWKFAGGGMVSNCEDLIKFGNWLLENYHKKDHEMLKTHRAAKMDEVVWLTGFDPTGGHGGASFGGSCCIYINKEKELVIVLLTNQTNSHTGMTRLVNLLADDY